MADKLKPIGSKLFDWVTVEPVWRGYRRFGLRGGAIGLFIVFMAGYFGIAMLLAIPWGLGSTIGITDMDSLPPTAMALAVPLVGYSAYRSYNFVKMRRKLYEYQQQPTLESAVEAFDYFDVKDDVSRGWATYTVADVLEDNPGKLIKRAGLDPEEAAFQMVDLLHDDNENVRMNGAHSVAYIARDFPEAVVQYRDDVFAAVKYPNSSIQGNAAIASANLTYYEPGLTEEVVRHIEPLCEDPDPDVRQMVSVALSNLQHERATELLQELAQDPNPEVRENAAEMLEMQQQEQQASP